MRRPKPSYSKYWPLLSRYVRHVLAHNQCQCEGECGLHRTHPGPRRCVERNHTPAIWAKGRVVLTVAHLCDCSPPCTLVAHVRACCPRCHLRLDQRLHRSHAAETRRLAQEQLGQLPLPFLGRAAS